MSDVLGYYQILAIQPNADEDTIKKSYRDLAKLWHPDNNQGVDTTDKFQKLSVAYSVLSNAESRLEYDILSLVCNSSNYPDLDIIEPFVINGNGTDVAAVAPQKITSWLVNWQSQKTAIVLDFKTSLKLLAKIALWNWLCGWWHPQAFVANFKALINNFKYPISIIETKRILLHNMIAYSKTKKSVSAALCGLRALPFLNEQERAKVKTYLSMLNVQIRAPKPWNLIWFRLIQLIVPVAIVAMMTIGLVSNNISMTEDGAWNWFAKQKQINYYQKVKFNSAGETVDDVVVGRVINIPVDKSDASKLYHLTQDVNIMYGPSKEFDIIKQLSAQTTVRLTGKTPDNVWARVMINNGETGFVPLECIEAGVGTEIPFGSAIID